MTDWATAEPLDAVVLCYMVGLTLLIVAHLGYTLWHQGRKNPTGEINHD